MVFLRRFRAVGFKSFADPVDITFSHPMSGVVGPNGAGKSNIVDAVRWVLGEQSMKSLRGKLTEDVIFHGSRAREAAPFSEVKLTFDNESGFIPEMPKTFEISRRAERDGDGSQYFIGGQPARLRDIQEMFLDSGLSKGSLGIISQGTVQWFAEAKPEDRRKIFEEAAGIGKYAKAKHEAVGKLALAEADFKRVEDLVVELERDLKRLKQQVERAQIFAEKQRQLADIEVRSLVAEIQHNQVEAARLTDLVGRLANTLQSDTESDTDHERRLQSFTQRERQATELIEDLNNRAAELTRRIATLETEKSLVNQRLEIDLSSLDKNKRAESLLEQLTSLGADIKDREQRLETANAEMKVYNEALAASQNRAELLRARVSTVNSELASLRSRKAAFEEQLNANAHFSDGVRTILEHKDHLGGIRDVVGNLLTVPEKYRLAIGAVLGNAAQNIVVDSDKDAVAAVAFLRENRSGTATFLPLDTIRPRSVSPEYMTVLRRIGGFEGIAADLIQYDKAYDSAVRFLLGSTVVATGTNDAASLSRHTYASYRVVSLEGDVVNPGGSVTGGFRRQTDAAGGLKAAVANLAEHIAKLEGESVTLKSQSDQAEQALAAALAKTSERGVTIAKVEEFLSSSRAAFASKKIEYEKLTGKALTGTTATPDQLNQELNSLQSRLDRVNEDLRVAKQQRASSGSSAKEMLEKYLEQRQQVADRRESLGKERERLLSAQFALNAATERLAEGYKLTFERAAETVKDKPSVNRDDARKIVANLRREIQAMGPVNAEAVEEYGQKENRFKTLAEERDSLMYARDQILGSIKEMDDRAVAALDQVVVGINAELPAIFRRLFGGGECSLSYVDPENVLESGVEVLAVPPGKTVTSLNLLSGGEKTMVALSVLFAILKVRSFPLVILDEAESALDPANVERFGKIVHESAGKTQFIVITHRPGTMERCDALFGATMQTHGVTKMVAVTLAQASGYASDQVEDQPS